MTGDNMLIPVLIITGISTFLAIVVVISDKLFNSYGECSININNEKDLKVDGGQTLLTSLSENKIFIPSACGGKATCGLCKVKVIKGGGTLLPTEEPYLSEEEKSDNIRLSCQVKVKNDMEIFIPDEIFSIKEYKTILEKTTDLTHDIKEFRFSLIIPPEIKIKAGQYIQVKTRPYGKIKDSVFRAYSVSSSPSEKGFLELIVRKVPGGICTTYMHDYLEAGDDVILTGPYGEFYIHEGADKYIFIAGGSGLAPIKSIVFDLMEKGSDKEMHFFFGAVSKKDLYYYDLFRQIEKKHRNFHYYPSLSRPADGDEWKGETGLITDIVAKHIKSSEKSHAYLCGSPGMIDACVKVLEQTGFDESMIFYDKF
jgi:Na+-transporting NADH:ubiquinone oxidoreductase subunit F